MNKNIFQIVLLTAWVAFSGAVPVLRAAEITVFAAASLTDALKQIAPGFTTATGHTLRFNLGGSGALARQIGEGVPADVFFSADEQRVEQLEKGGLLLSGTRRCILANALVVIVPADAPGGQAATLADLALPAIRRIALGEPATVPIGTYAKEHLGRHALWEPLRAKVVFMDNARAVLAAVEAGNADAGLVYQTDALSTKKVRVACAIPLAEGPRITYPAAVLQASKRPDVARAFVDWLTAPAAQAVFARHGFLPAP